MTRVVHGLELHAILVEAFAIRAVTKDEKLIAAFSTPPVTILERLR
jgi:hypothetical protein